MDAETLGLATKNQRFGRCSHHLAGRYNDGDLSASVYQDISSRIDYLRDQLPDQKGKGHGNEQGNNED